MKNQVMPIALIVLAVVLAGIWVLAQGVNRRYQQEVNSALGFWAEETTDLLKQEELEPLPQIVQRYIQQSGAVGKPKVWNYRVTMKGKLRKDAESPWMPITSHQYNFMKSPVRLYYMDGRMSGLPVYGLHAYKNEEAQMNVFLLGLMEVVNVSGDEMNISDTVTLFNDMCLFAPGTLMDKRISWETLDPLTVRATFKNGSQSVKADLFFNDLGELVDFISEDRYRIDKTAEKLKWSTPIHGYKDFSGLKLISSGSAVWHKENKHFSYAEFDVVSIEYNVPNFK